MDGLMNDQAQKINFIPCIKWVQRGVAKSNPEKVELTKEELREIIVQTESRLRVDSNEEEDDDDDNEGSSNNMVTNQPENAEDEFNLEKYDEESDADHLNVGSLATIAPEEEEGNSDSDSEKEDDIIKNNDNLILVGHVEGDASILEVYVYNESEESFYVHHDILLPSFPLCFEWLDYEPGHSERGSYCAIGSMSPEIEIWDLDVVNCLEPAYRLGQVGSRRKRIPHVGHYDAVLDLAWNKNYHHILASGSVDKTVLLWDLDEGKPHTTLKKFTDKVQCLKWHQSEAQSLLAGSCDKTVKVFDCRTDSTYKTWNLDGEAERVIWDPHEPYCFMVGTSTGSVQGFDSRQEKMLWHLDAHEEEVTGIVVSSKCKGLMATSSSDGTLKTWEYSCSCEQPPVLVHCKDLKMDRIHCLEFCPDLPFVLAAGGDRKNNNLTVLDLRSIDPVNHTFGTRELVNTETINDVEMDE